MNTTLSDWSHTIIGILDATWSLTDLERYHSLEVINKLLTYLRIPERSTPVFIPIDVALEVQSQFWSLQLEKSQSSIAEKPIRKVQEGDQTYPLEVWRTSIEKLILNPYPDLEPTERLLLSKYLTELLSSLGVPDRAPVFLPENVVNIARNP